MNFSKVCAHCGSYEKLSQNLPTLKTERENTLLILKSGDTTYYCEYIIGIDNLLKKKVNCSKPEHFYGHCCV